MGNRGERFRESIFSITTKIALDLVNAWNKGILLKKIQDFAIIENISCIGTTYPLSLIHEALEAYYKIDPNQIFNDAIMGIEEDLYSRWKRNRFHYFEPSCIPEDLDTACSLTRSLKRHPEVISSFHDLVSHSWRADYIPTFLAPTEKEVNWLKQKLYCGATYWHPDVLANYLYLKSQLISMDYAKWSDFTEFPSFVPINFWFLPATYTYFRLWQTNITLPESYSFQFKNFKDLLYTHSNVPEMQYIFNSRRTNALELLLYYCTCCTCKKIFKEQSNLAQLANRLVDDDCSLYPTVGFKVFRSQLVYKAIALLGISWFQNISEAQCV